MQAKACHQPACGGWAETKAAYRFFDNEKVEPEKIDESHLKMTLLRMSQEKVVLIPQDTTVLNFSKQLERKRIGSYVHPKTKPMSTKSNRQWVY